MNKEIIGAMLSSDTPPPINGEGRGGRSNFTKADAMYCVSGMPSDAWDYMQFVDVMLDEKFMQVSSRCGRQLLMEYFEKLNTIITPGKLQRICEVALCELRERPFSEKRRFILCSLNDDWFNALTGTTCKIENWCQLESEKYLDYEFTWHEWKTKYKDIYSMALSIYNRWDNDAGYYIRKRLKSET